MPRVLYSAIGVVLLLIGAPLLTSLDGKPLVAKVTLVFFGGLILLSGVLLLVHGVAPRLLRRRRR